MRKDEFLEPDTNMNTNTLPIRPRSAQQAGPRAALRKLLEEWRGRPYASDDEAWAVLRDPRRVLEKACLVRIEHRPRGEGSGVWTEVAGVWPLMKGQAVESLRWPPTLYVPGMHHAEEVLRLLPEWVRKKMGTNAFDVATKPAPDGSDNDHAQRTGGA